MIILPIPSGERLPRILGITFFGFKIIGLAPFTLQRTKAPAGNSRNPCDTNTFVFSKIGLVYNILLLILVLVMGVFAIPQLVLMSYPNKSFVTQTIDVMNGIIRTSTSCVVILSWAVRQKVIASIMNRLLDVKRLFSGMEKQPSSKKTSFIFFLVYAIFNTFMWITFWVTVEASFNGFPDWFIANVPLFVINWFVFEYSILLGIVARDFENLNKNLLNLKEFQNSSFSNHTFPTLLLNDYLAILESLPTQNQLSTLKVLRTIRTSLYEVSLDIAEFFSLPILPCIACFFLTLIYNIYYLVAPIVIPIGVLALTLTDNLNTIVWICISIYPLILLAVNVTEITKEAELTGLIVHKLLAASKRPEIKIELEQFSYELLHEYMSFTAYGFFTLDFTLIQSIRVLVEEYIKTKPFHSLIIMLQVFGATVTYLVIIIQFMRSASTVNNASI